MSSSTHLTSFNEAITSFCINYILTPLSSSIEHSKGYKISVDEMINLLNINSTASTPVPRPPTINNVPTLQMPNIPNFLKGNVTTPNKTNKIQQGRGRKKTIPSPPNPNATPCPYIFQRGDRKGQMCGEPSTDSSQFCRNCLKKRGVQQVLTSGGSSTTSSQVKAPTIPGSLSTSSSSTQPIQKELEVINIPGRQAMFKELKHGFIVRQMPDGTIIALKIEDGNGGERNLTDDEKKLANSMGIATPIDDSSHENDPDDDLDDDDDVDDDNDNEDDENEDDSEEIATRSSLSKL